MSQDVLDFIEQNSLSSVHIIAHSMGGKVALWLALNQPELVKKLVIVDIAPVSYQHEFDAVLKGFKSVDRRISAIQSRQEADDILKKSIKQATLRHFLLQNLQFREGQYQWRLNLDAIGRSIPVITGFPDTKGLSVYSKHVLFIGGGQSDYLIKANQNLTRQLFPLASFSIIKSAGHWLHSEQPEIFLALITPYLSR